MKLGPSDSCFQILESFQYSTVRVIWATCIFFRLIRFHLHISEVAVFEYKHNTELHVMFYLFLFARARVLVLDVDGENTFSLLYSDFNKV